MYFTASLSYKYKKRAFILYFFGFALSLQAQK